ncbi:GILT-domain-containing protein [Fragilariopsis cylindrus CCMP1102]|uniref:GILT-domain-containing protein n=1 Tax=Fragilariopsis cylindrus CCMP1102 TaxID=635003 RepID=A0A1E7ET35_9STRA|nr:GILT-domain-containing protein [Fragilariopsis cylindrus CCMP1102]|eukprot:OEU09006.1 GILT-domain-containing protein [Fragilariopsis cylindrus CCMP1102]
MNYLSLFAYLVAVVVVVVVGNAVAATATVTATATTSTSTSTSSNIVKDNDVGNNDKVQVELYYESQCPGCREMITTSFYDAYQNDGLLDMAVITFIPYGNAQHKNPNPNTGLVDFKCQHGPSECIYNIIETCALDKIKGPSDQFEFLNCIENHDENRDMDQDYYNIAFKCAIEANLKDAVVEEIKICSTSQEGNELEHEMAVKTESLIPPHTYVPYVVVNGVHNDDIQTDVTDSLFDYVCKTYTGPNKSSNCPTTIATATATTTTTTFGVEEEKQEKEEEDHNVCYRDHADFISNNNGDNVVLAATTAATTTVLRRRQRLM